MDIRHTDSIVKPAMGSHLETAHTLAVKSANIAVDTGGMVSTTLAKRSAPRSNVLSNLDHSNAISSALTDIAEVVGRTLGPHGSNTLIRDESGSHIATKDGYTVLQRLTYVQETATMVLDHIRSVSRAVVRKVGDGSTSAVIMADSLYHSLKESVVLNEMPAGPIQTSLNIIADIISEIVSSKAKPITSYNDILDVATISANNDKWAGKLIADAYALGGENANVFVTIGGDKTEIKKEPGYRVMRGMVHDCFANEVGIDGSSKTICRIKDSKVLVFGEVIDQAVFNNVIAPVMNDVIATGKPFTLVARDYTTDVIDLIVNFKRNSPGLQLLLVDHANATRRSSSRLGDLAAVLNCKTFTTEQVISIDELGYAAEIRSTPSETVFVIEEVSHQAITRAQEISDQIMRVDTNNHDESMTEELDELKARVRALAGSEVTIAIGGATDLEKKTLQYLLDDAALAVAAAKKGGIVEGLGMTALRQNWHGIAKELENRINERLALPAEDVQLIAISVTRAVKHAYERCVYKVFNNAKVKDPEEVLAECIGKNIGYNALTRRYSDIDSIKVVNPALTDIEVIKGAMSIVSLFLASNQTLLTRFRSGGDQD
jgi:chaperonin GroEL